MAKNDSLVPVPNGEKRWVKELTRQEPSSETTCKSGESTGERK